VGVFDPSTDAFSVVDISGVIAVDNKYYGGVLAPNGKIYFVPHGANRCIARSLCMFFSRPLSLYICIDDTCTKKDRYIYVCMSMYMYICIYII
jgi:hypothetical protein